MKLIFGLGNIGDEYINTRHNVGFQLIDYFKEKYHVGDVNTKMNGEVFKVIIGKEDVLLIKPLKLMNLSGEVVKKYMDFYKVSLEDILVIQDDIDMNLGKIKFAYNSSSGGHNGIKNISLCLNTMAYFRLKIGVRNDNMINARDYVLGKFSEPEKDIIRKCYLFLDSLVEDFVLLKRSEIMNKYNNRSLNG